ncbi:VPLPA-CTERM sorting domain-containing protein [Albidovulum sp.]|uniref:VPLPA-CTERM sorting domain-containing protein n=1 Tax=Albidovulum sp. TaxID=1872424 RepID=UPI0039B93971
MFMKSIAGAAVLAVTMAVSAAQAATYSFVGVTSNSGTNVTTGQNQLSVDVLDLGAGKVSFTFNNAGPLAASVTDVYWDDQAGLLKKMGAIGGSAGVSYSQGATPGNLPGGNPIGFSVSPTGASADSNSGPGGVMKNGVNPGEWLTIVWSLVTGKTYGDVLAALNLGGDQSGSLRIGIHVQGFGNGGSESFVNGTPAPVPVPAAGVLLMGGLAAMGLMRRRRA